MSRPARPAVFLLLCLSLLLRCAAVRSAESVTSCPTVPQFQALVNRLNTMGPAASLSALDAYVANPANENPNACEALELDGLIAQRERSLVTLSIGGRKIAPGAVFNCNVLQGRTLACNGAVEDATAHPATSDMQFEPPQHPVAVTLMSTLPGMTLIRVYVSRTGDLLDGIPPAPLNARGSGFRLNPASNANILFAIFRAPPPWRFRKFVWYFGHPWPAATHP
jgi:hypothetical protein